MKTLVDHLSQYADYHRDRRNIATHFVGIPMIVFAVAVLLSRPALDVAGVPFTIALMLAVASSIFYLRLHVGLGVLMTGLMALAVWGGHRVAAESTMVWLSTGVGLFVVGWIIQFVGHYYEGRKPAFVDDLVGLVVGPLFVVAEWLFMMGMMPSLQSAIEERVGPTRINPAKTPHQV
ncbi:hypothetical protein BTA51_05770 [Hahella sp. CCB-MM4]|uniref:Mpo1 family 2-hydroxy fatty acid dioxygenase n=1 Tax=Hahella sp. (strain CCB-MM4) TaxID=1926491 RepID=UPI000B9A38AD|nr:Mpo1-like protein [Hahella sp. CCB-MM4]OZG74507.1 hypothetical protein BTA51_05770 [Hahella sp. CCB-MM4]